MDNPLGHKTVLFVAAWLLSIEMYAFSNYTCFSSTTVQMSVMQKSV